MKEETTLASPGRTRSSIAADKPKKVATKRSRNSGRDAREAILDAGIEHFSRLGYEGVSTAAIAKAANVSQPTVLYYFESKDAVWKASMDRLFSRVSMASLYDESAFKDLDPFSVLRISIRRFVHASARYPALGRVILQEATAGGDRFEWLYERHIAPNYADYLALIDSAMASGKIKRFDRHMLLILIHSSAAMLFNLAPLSQKLLGTSPFGTEMVEAHADLVVEVLFSGLAKAD